MILAWDDEAILDKDDSTFNATIHSLAECYWDRPWWLAMGSRILEDVCETCYDYKDKFTPKDTLRSFYEAYLVAPIPDTDWLFRQICSLIREVHELRKVERALEAESRVALLHYEERWDLSVMGIRIYCESDDDFFNLSTELATVMRMCVRYTDELKPRWTLLTMGSLGPLPRALEWALKEWKQSL